MASPSNPFRDAPISLNTPKAHRVLGKCIENWSTDPGSHPAKARTEADGRLIVISKQDLTDHLANLPDPDDRLNANEITFHPAVAEIELLLRRPDRVSMVLPDARAIAFQQGLAARGAPVTVTLPSLYKVFEHEQLGLPWSEIDLSAAPTDTTSTETILIGGDPFDQFLRPYLASYCCAQCI